MVKYYDPAIYGDDPIEPNGCGYEDRLYVTEEDYAALEARVAELEGKLRDSESDVDTMAEHNIELQGKVAELEKDAARYRWLRDPSNDVSMVVEKQTVYLERCQATRTGGYWIYENRSGDDLDSVIDEAMSRET